MATSSLPGPALQASKAALSNVISDTEKSDKGVTTNGNTADEAKGDLEDGEIPEVDMENQAESIRTVFNDPSNFNVKVSQLSSKHACDPLVYNIVSAYRLPDCPLVHLAPAVLAMDFVVRLARYEGPQFPADAVDSVSSYPQYVCTSYPRWPGSGRLDGGHQARHHHRQC
jgi:hypothetical protein